MPYSEDKEASADFKGGFHTKGVTPEIKERIKKEQKKFTLSEVAALQSELSKAHRQFKQGLINLKTYEDKRNEIIKKYNITKEERIRFLGAKFAS